MGGWNAGEFDARFGAWVRVLWAGGDEHAEALVREFWGTRPWESQGGAP